MENTINSWYFSIQSNINDFESKALLSPQYLLSTLQFVIYSILRIAWSVKLAILTLWDSVCQTSIYIYKLETQWFHHKLSWCGGFAWQREIGHERHATELRYSTIAGSTTKIKKQPKTRPDPQAFATDSQQTHECLVSLRYRRRRTACPTSSFFLGILLIVSLSSDFISAHVMDEILAVSFKVHWWISIAWSFSRNLCTSPAKESFHFCHPLWNFKHCGSPWWAAACW